MNCSYTESFQKNHITFDLLPELTEQLIDKLGVYAVGDRIRLNKALDQLQPKVRVCSGSECNRVKGIRHRTKANRGKRHIVASVPSTTARSPTPISSNTLFCEQQENATKVVLQRSALCDSAGEARRVSYGRRRQLRVQLQVGLYGQRAYRLLQESVAGTGLRRLRAGNDRQLPEEHRRQEARPNVESDGDDDPTASPSTKQATTATTTRRRSRRAI